MAKLDPAEYLESLRSTKKEANKLKAGIVRYEKTASKHTKTLADWVTTSRTKFDDAVNELKSHYLKESQDLKRTAKIETASVESVRKEAKNHYNQFSKTYTAAMNKRSGISAKHDKISKLTDDATANANEISKHLTATSNAKTSIDDLLKKSKINGKDIASIHEEAEKVNQEIKNTYGITLDTTMAGTLVDRRNALKKRTEIWERAYLSSVGVIVIAILLALTISRPDSFIQVMTDRLVFVTPLILVAAVLNRQFTHERKLYEEYAFKAATALSLRGYTVLLNDEFKDMHEARRDILDFTIDAMRDIYNREPLVPNPSTIHLVLGNNMAKFEAKIEEKVHIAVKEAILESKPASESKTAISST